MPHTHEYLDAQFSGNGRCRGTAVSFSKYHDGRSFPQRRRRPRFSLHGCTGICGLNEYHCRRHEQHGLDVCWEMVGGNAFDAVPGLLRATRSQAGF